MAGSEWEFPDISSFYRGESAGTGALGVMHRGFLSTGLLDTMVIRLESRSWQWR